MKCYDCTLEARDETVAVGVCRGCGLFTCSDHSEVVPAAVHRPNGLGASYSRLSGRRVVCLTCRAAETAR